MLTIAQNAPKMTGRSPLSGNAGGSTPGSLGAQQVEIEGSRCPAVTRSVKTGNVDPNEQLTVSVVLKHPEDMPEPKGPFQSMSPEQYKRYESTQQQLQSMQQFAQKNGLKVVDSNSKTHTVKISGSAASLGKAFGVQLGKYKDANGNEFRAYTGAVKMSAEHAPHVQSVLGLDNRPFAQPHIQFAPAANPNIQSYTAPEIASLYNFPKGTDGSGQTIGIIELGGGYKDEDLQAYFDKIGVKAPEVKWVSVDGGKNEPTGSANSADGEVDLDIEIAGGVAPGAKVVVYFAPNSDQGFIDAINQAVHDKENHPNTLSISWGAPEKEWTPQAMAAMNSAFKDAASLGVNVFCASGDSGAKDGEHDGKLHVDFPAASPYAIGCGGTKLKSSNGHKTSEVAWNDHLLGGSGGGGVSDNFGKPDYQSNVNVPASSSSAGGRGVPDVAGNASPLTGYEVIVDGTTIPVGGTSAVSPLYAGLAARLGQGVGGNLGFLNPVFYKHQGDFNDITSGNNGGYKAGPGWDAATGLGSPDGEKILSTLKSLQAQQQDQAQQPPTQAKA
jgi:kumamolisin